MLTLAAIAFGTVALVILFLVISLAMIGIVLIQKPSGGGLSGAFGAGSGSGQTAFGTKTGDALTIITVVFFAAWLGLAMGLNWATKPPTAPTPTTAQGEPPAPGDPATPDADESTGTDPGQTDPAQTDPADTDAGTEPTGQGETGPQPSDPQVPPATEPPSDPPTEVPDDPGVDPGSDPATAPGADPGDDQPGG